MVGVPKSTGCAVCRKRKIKCDETWPICVNCQKNGKCCPGQPAKHTFKDLGPRLNSNVNALAVEDGPIVLDQRSHSPQHMTQLNEKYAENGSVTYKFRISHARRRAATTPSSLCSVRSSPSSLSSPPSMPRSPLPRNPSPSQHHELARALVIAISTGSVGHRMSAFGPFIREVPARIGHSAALDAAVACLVNAHSSLVHQKMGNDIVNIELYLRAVQTLQTSLEDPREGMSSNTLCASVLLGLVEALAGPRQGNRYLAHVGGAGRLMEVLGPKKCQDPFAKELLQFNRGGIIITSIYERRPCFLTLPEWRDIAFDKTGLSNDDCVIADMLHRMADFPALLNELKQLGEELGASSDSFNFSNHAGNSVPDFSTNIDPMLDYLHELPPVGSPYSIPIHASYPHPDRRTKLLGRLQGLKDALYGIGEHFTAKLNDGSAATELPASEDNCPIPTALHFNNWRVAVAYNCFWSLLILTNKVMMKILEPYSPTAYGLEAECRNISLEICKTWEHAWENKPIGAFHTGLSFVTAYEFCTPEVKEWILKGLNSLLDYQVVESFRWSEDVVKMMSGKLAGEGVDMVFSSVKAGR